MLKGDREDCSCLAAQARAQVAASFHFPLFTSNIVLQFYCLLVVDVFVGQCNPDWSVPALRPVVHSAPSASSHVHYSTKTAGTKKGVVGGEQNTSTM